MRLLAAYLLELLLAAWAESSLELHKTTQIKFWRVVRKGRGAWFPVLNGGTPNLNDNG